MDASFLISLQVLRPGECSGSGRKGLGDLGAWPFTLLDYRVRPQLPLAVPA
jgi:hypothetical protein